jgi:simple sugar transport system substrate-binding protein
MDQVDRSMEKNEVSISRRRLLASVGISAGGLATISAAGIASLGLSEAAAEDAASRPTLNIPLMMACCFGNPFYAPMIKGMETAAKQYNVNTKFYAPAGTDDAPGNATMVASLLASKPDGLAVDVVYSDAVDAPLRGAIKSGIPIIASNGPDDRPPEQRIPYLFYVGGDEYKGGVAAANRMLAERKPAAAVCVNPQAGHGGLQQRWLGFKATMDKAGLKSEQLILQNPDPTQTAEQLRGYLTSHPETDAIYSVSASLILDPALRVLDQQKLTGKVMLITNDLLPSAITAIQNGSLLALIDQQQYLQGWAPIAFLALNIRYGFTLAQDILTGPAVVDKSNVDKLVVASKEGIR